MTVIVERVDDYSNVRGFVERILKNLDSFENLKERLDLKSVEDLPERIVLKPNFLKWMSPESGCTTHPEVVKAVAKAFEEMGKRIFIVEGGFTKSVAERYFEVFSLRNYGECINLNVGEFVRIPVNGKRLKSVKASKNAVRLLEDSFFVSLPKLKVHHLTMVTLSIKNNMGFLKKPAARMHLSISPKLVDLLNIFNPHLIILDGIIAGEYSESNPKPVNHAVMLAGDNAVEIDAVGAYLMGFEPKEIGFLKIAYERGFGEIDVDKIDLIGSLDGLRKKYSISGIRRFLGRLSI
jgi:uncharacterized protein (DUF362 family)